MQAIANWILQSWWRNTLHKRHFKADEPKRSLIQLKFILNYFNSLENRQIAYHRSLTFSSNRHTIRIVELFGSKIRVDVLANSTAISGCWWLLAMVVRLALDIPLAFSWNVFAEWPSDRVLISLHSHDWPVRMAVQQHQCVDTVDLEPLQWLMSLELDHHLAVLTLLLWQRFYRIHPNRWYSYSLQEKVNIFGANSKKQMMVWVELLTFIAQIHASTSTATRLLGISIWYVCSRGRWTMLLKRFWHFQEVFLRLCHRQIRQKWTGRIDVIAIFVLVSIRFGLSFTRWHIQKGQFIACFIVDITIRMQKITSSR